MWMKLQKRQTTPLLSCGGMLQGAQEESRLNATPLLSSLWWSTQLLPGTHTLPETFSSLKQSSAEQPGLSLVTTSSTSQMIASLGWSSLQQRRIDARLVMMYIPWSCRYTSCTILTPNYSYVHSRP